MPLRLKTKLKLKWHYTSGTYTAVCGLVKLAVGVEDPLAEKVTVWWTAEPVIEEDAMVGDGEALIKHEVLKARDDQDLTWLMIKAETWLLRQIKAMGRRLER